MIELVRSAGFVAFVLIGLAVLSSVVSLVLSGLAAFRLRVPAPVWFLGPMAVLLTGYAGCAWAVTVVKRALAAASPDMVPPIAAVGWSECLAAVVLAHALAAAVLLAQAWMGAIGHAVRVGPEPRWSLGFGALVVFAAGALAVGQGGWLGFALGPTSAAMAIPACLLLGAPALAVVSARISTFEADGDAGRLATARVTVGICWTGAVLCAAIAANLTGEMQAFQARGMAAPEMVATVAPAGLELQRTAWAQGFVAVLPALALSVFAGLSESRSIESNRTVAGVIGTALMIVLVVIAHAFAMAWGKGLVAMAA